MPEPEETERCPFCNGRAGLVESAGLYWVECGDCLAIGPQRPSERSARGAWNARHR